MLSQLSASSRGKGSMLAITFFIAATIPMTESAVIDGLGESIAETLENESHEGGLRIAVLAGEVQERVYIKSPEYEDVLWTFLEKGVDVGNTAWNLYLYRGQKPEDVGLVCQAADGGIIKAQNLLGKLYSSGEGVPQDLKKAY